MPLIIANSQSISDAASCQSCQAGRAQHKYQLPNATTTGGRAEERGQHNRGGSKTNSGSSALTDVASQCVPTALDLQSNKALTHTDEADKACCMQHSAIKAQQQQSLPLLKLYRHPGRDGSEERISLLLPLLRAFA